MPAPSTLLIGALAKLAYFKAEQLAPLLALISNLAPTQSPALVADLERRLEGEFLGSDLFGNVLPERLLDDSMPKERAFVFSHVANKNLRLLELGTWKAWPDTRVLQLLKGQASQSGGFSEFIRLDYDDTFNPDLVASCYAIPLREGAVDYVRSNSLLEHVRDPLTALRECYRILSPGGVMQHTMPLHFPLHGYPKDFSRLTPDYFTEFCNDLGFEDVIVSVTGTCGRLYTALNLVNSFNLQIQPERAALVELVKVMLLLLSELDRDDIDRSAVAHSIYVRARKSGALQPRQAHRDENGILELPPGTSTLTRISDDVVDPVSKTKLVFRGDVFVGDVEYPVKENRVGYLRDIDGRHLDD